MIVFQTSNPKIADVVQASGEVFEYTPAPQPKPQQLVVPVGQVKEEVPA